MPPANPLDRFARRLLAQYIQRNFYRWDRARLQAHHAARLKSLLAYAARRSPYYARLRKEGWDGTLNTLPVLSKREYIAHYDEINTAGLKSAELSSFAVQMERAGKTALYQGQYSVGLSSGTSGSKLITVLSRQERRNYSSLLFARSGIPETVRNPRVLFALRVNNPAFMETRALGITLVHIDYTHPAEEVAKLVNEMRLNVLAGPPSLLVMLARIRDRIDHAIEGVISYAEVLDDSTRAELEHTFGVRVAQIYQGAEGFIASTCRAGRLHLNEDMLYIEALAAGDSLGNARTLVVTDLYRRAQPFIRYAMGDLVELSSTPCECGSCFCVVERIHGRADDIFYLRGQNGEVRCLFPDYVTRSINQASDAILEFQALQHSLDEIEIRLVLDDNSERPAVEQAIRANLAAWAEKAGGRLGRLTFSTQPPERNPNSRKLIRVVRRF